MNRSKINARLNGQRAQALEIIAAHPGNGKAHGFELLVSVEVKRGLAAKSHRMAAQSARIAEGHLVEMRRAVGLIPQAPPVWGTQAQQDEAYLKAYREMYGTNPPTDAERRRSAEALARKGAAIHQATWRWHDRHAGRA